MDRRSGLSKRYGFVYFKREEDAIKAKEALNATKVHGNQVRIDFSYTKKPHSPTPGRYMGKTSRSRYSSGRYSHPYYRSRRSPPRSSYDYYDRRGSRDYYDRYDDRYEDRYDRYDDRYEDRYDDRYEDRYEDRYDDRRYDDHYDDDRRRRR
jgi:transformer-2 protein